MLCKSLTALLLLSALTGCGLVSSQAVYESVRSQERSKDAGSSGPPAAKLPPFEVYQKDRSALSPDKR